MTEPLDLEAIRVLADKATPGPWSAADEHGDWPGATPAWCVSRMDGEEWLHDVFYHASQSDGEQAERDSEFIAAARTLIPQLVDALAAAQTRGDEWRKIAEYGLHLAMYGEHAPGGNETWREFERRMRERADRDKEVTR